MGNRYRNGQPDEAYKHGNFTLAGQTANDKGGVHMANSRTNRCRSGGGEVTFNIFRQEEMILRYFDTRYNWQWWAVPPGTANTDCRTQEQIPSLRIEEAKNLVIDHISSGWSSYGLPIASPPGNGAKGNGNISVQRSLMHENAYNTQSGINSLNGRNYQHNHNVGMLLGDGVPGTTGNSTSFSIHKNAFIGVSHRMPNTAGRDYASFSVINNYSFGFTGDGNQRLSRIAGSAKNDFINNVYQQTNSSVPFAANENGDVRNNLLGFEFSAFSNPSEVTPNFFINGNLFLNKQGEELEITSRIERDPRLMLFSYIGANGRTTDNRGPNLNENDHRLILRQNPIPAAENPVKVLPANLVKQDILSNVGGNVRFKSDGSTYIDNPVDKNYISWALNNAGPEHTTRVLNDGGVGDTGGNNTEFGEFRFKHPNYSQAPAVDLAVYDTDLDGMPNEWEIKHGLNPNSKNSSAVRSNRNWTFGKYLVKNNAGYTDLEMYLADIAGDFHMLAKTEGKPINHHKDELKSISMPTTIMPSTTVEALIEYSANGKRDIKCYLRKTGTNKVIAFDKAVVNAGSNRLATCDLSIPSDAPAGNNYELYTRITKVNGKWSERFDDATKGPIKIPALKDDIVSINIPPLVTTGSKVTTYINYMATAKRDIKCFLKNANGKVVKFEPVAVSAGVGNITGELDGVVTDAGSAAQCTFDLPANMPKGEYSLYIFMTKSKGKWSERFDEITESMIIE